MRGFAFSVDMAFGVLLIILFVTLFTHSLQAQPVDAYTLLQIRAKDAAMAWFYTSYSPAQPPADSPHACSVAFRPRVSDELLSPFDDADWVFHTECVTYP